VKIGEKGREKGREKGIVDWFTLIFKEKKETKTNGFTNGNRNCCPLHAVRKANGLILHEKDPGSRWGEVRRPFSAGKPFFPAPLPRIRTMAPGGSLGGRGDTQKGKVKKSIRSAPQEGTFPMIAVSRSEK
jgi:hypothetical protein